MGLSTLVAAEWHKPEVRARAEQWVAETGAALRPRGAPRLRELPGAKHAGASSRDSRG